MSGSVERGQIEFYEAVVDRDEDDENLGRIDIVAPTRYGNNVIRRVLPIFPPFFCGRPNRGDSVIIFEFPGGQIYYISRSSEPPEWTNDVSRVGFSSRSGNLQIGIQSDANEVRLGSFDAVQMAVIWEPLKVILQAIIVNLNQLNGHYHDFTGTGTVKPVTGCSYGNASTDINGDKAGSDVVRLIKDKPNG
jgi:hypothetical protein